MNKSIIFTVVLVALLFVSIKAGNVPGGFVEMKTDDPGLIRALKNLEVEMNNKVDAGHKYVVKKVLWAAGKFAQGMIYLVDFQFVQTDSKKGSKNVEIGTDYLLCNAKIYDKTKSNTTATTNDFELKHIYCTQLIEPNMF